MANIHTGSFVNGISSDLDNADRSRIYGDVRPELGAFHPLNTFKSHLARKRIKPAFCFTTVLRIDHEDSEDGHMITFDISAKTVGDAPVVWDVRLPSGAWVERVQIELVSDDGAVVQNLVEQTNNYEHVVATTLQGGNSLFWAAGANYILTSALGGRILRHRLRLSPHTIPGDRGVFAVVGFPNEHTLSAITNDFDPSPHLLPLPPSMRTGYELPVMGKTHVFTSGLATIDLETEAPEGNVFGLVFYNCNYSVSAWFEAPAFARALKTPPEDDRVYLFKDIPTDVLCTDGYISASEKLYDGVFIWQNDVSGFSSCTYRSTFGIDTRFSKSEGSTKLYVQTTATDFKLAWVAIVRIDIGGFDSEGFKWFRGRPLRLADCVATS